MKADYLRRFRLRLFGKILLQIGVSVAATIAIMFLADGIFNNIIAETLSQIDRGFYLFLTSHKTGVVFVVFFTICVLTIASTLLKTTRYLSQIINSIDKVFQKDESLVELPDEFKDVENKLNSIKYDSLRSEQLAREAEQRKNDLVMYLAHDLKTPLTSIIGYLNLLSEEEEIPIELRAKYTKIALDKALRLEELINEFFEITRFNLQNIELEKSEVNLSLLLEQLTDEFYPLLAEKNLTCNTELEQNLTLTGDADKLARVFDNLLRNAIHYCYENTAIDITASAQENFVTVCFRNRGKAIAENKLERLFEKFYRADASRSSSTGGAGLGLAIAKEIVTLHKGTITAESSEAYTEFRVNLPRRA